MPSRRVRSRRKVRAAAAGAARAAQRHRVRSADFGESLYDAEQRDELPDAAALASLGCGNPTAVAELRAGEVVLDLGSGRRYRRHPLGESGSSPAGTAYGLDMTDEMLALAQQNARDGGDLERALPQGRDRADPACRPSSVDVVISNCVINLSTDKAGRVGRDRPRAAARRPDRHQRRRRRGPARRRRSAPSAGSFVGCIAGALSKASTRAGLEAAGFDRISVEFTHEVADGMHGAIVKAVKPADPADGPAGAPAGCAGGLLLVDGRPRERALRLCRELPAVASWPSGCFAGSRLDATRRARPAANRGGAACAGRGGSR